MNSVLIDGAVPRTESERVSSLLAEAEALYNQYHNGTNYDIEHEIIALEEVYQHQMLDEDFEFWNEVEDEIIDLINEILPDDVLCSLHTDDPGTIVVWDVRHDEEN